jgi:Protein of unknown function (DUF1499)
MRRHLPEEPMSAAAVWSRRIALMAALVALLAVGMARMRSVEPTAALAVLGAAISLALLALLLFGAACVDIWQTGRRGVAEAVWALVLVTLVLAYPAYLSVQAVRFPVLADISTDLVDPPTFSFSGSAFRARAGFRPAAIPAALRQQQIGAYSDVETIVIDVEAEEAFPMVLKAAAARGWRLIDQRPPGGRLGEGHADFLDHSLVMGFDEDIVVRLRPLPGQTRIDLRAASRYGRHDFGANARKIEQFADELQSQLDAR